MNSWLTGRLARISTNALLAVLLVAVAATGGIGCHYDERVVTYENGTQLVLTIFSDGYELATLKPGETSSGSTRKHLLPDHVEAYDQAGNLRFDKVITWEELEANDFTLVIR